MVKLLIPYALRRKRLLAISMALLVPLAIAEAVQPILIGQAVALIRSEETLWFLEGRSFSTGLNILIALLATTIAVKLLLDGFQGYQVQKVGQNITADIRDDVFHHVTSLSLSFFDRTPVGRLITRLTSDVEALGDVFSTGAIGIVGDFFTMIVIAIFMFIEQWQLALLLILILFPISFLTIYFQEQYRRANYRAREELSALNSNLQENIVGVGVVQLFRRERFNSEVFRSINQRYIEEVDRTILFDSAVSATLEWVALAAIGGVLWLGGGLVMNDYIELATLTSFVLFAQRLFNPLRQFAEKFTAIQAGFTSLERVSDILSEPIEIRDPGQAALPDSITKNERAWRSRSGIDGDGRSPHLTDPLTAQLAAPLTAPLTDRSPDAEDSEDNRAISTPLPQTPRPSIDQPVTPGTICFDHVWFGYKPDEFVIRDLSFTIQPGEKVAIVGPTGAGKSSIIRLLCRLYDIQKGQILLDGTDIRDLRQAELRQRMTVILQDGFLFAGDVKSNIALGESYSIEEIRMAAEKTNVAAFIEQLPDAYDTELRQRGTNLSGGQKQLLAFARAAIRNPPILVLDEATANLDVGTEAMIQDALEHLLVGRTAIIIAHRLSTIRNVDRILVLKQGSLVETGSHDELLDAGGLYASLYRLQMLES
ncbi:MAG: ABC transporter ATP-binding protein [Leptolyngbyaceae bacterium]|nr:ABC transporter ATP-binding protein [Leptolyngbyaceae bacterium]